MDNVWSAILVVVLFVLGIYGITGLGWHLDKMTCEKHLPRNVVCTWQAPTPPDTKEKEI